VAYDDLKSRLELGGPKLSFIVTRKNNNNNNSNSKKKQKKTKQNKTKQKYLCQKRKRNSPIT